MAKRLKQMLLDWTTAVKRADPLVPGWLTQLLLLIAGWIFIYQNRVDDAWVAVTGVLVIGVIRTIEKDRRKQP